MLLVYWKSYNLIIFTQNLPSRSQDFYHKFQTTAHDSDKALNFLWTPDIVLSDGREKTMVHLSAHEPVQTQDYNGAGAFVAIWATHWNLLSLA